MSDSLRDQLMKAGFKEAAPDPKKARKKGRGNGSEKRHTGSSQKPRNHKAAAKKSGGKSAGQTKDQPNEAEEAARLAEKKAIKEKIKTLIETHRVKEHTGTVAYSYQLGSRVKQLFVTDECQQKLADGELLITRLNGSTYLIPPSIAEQITALNPDWALIAAGSQSDEAIVDEAYADYQVPDDLTW